MNRKWPLTVDQEIHHRISDWSWDKFQHLILVSNQAHFKGGANSENEEISNKGI